MPTSKRTSPRRGDVTAEYSYRRPLALRELLPAIGIGIVAGMFAFYVTRLLLQRTPLKVHRGGEKSARPRPGARSLDRSMRP